jgi:hypothetical protein
MSCHKHGISFLPEKIPGGVREKYNDCNETLLKGASMLNAVYRFCARRFIPRDDEVELADALFNWKYNK